MRQQFEADLRALTDAEQDSKELKSAKRALLFDRIVESAELPFPVGPPRPEGERHRKDTMTKQFLKRAAEAIYKDLVRKKIAVENAARTGAGRRTSARSSARSASRRARTARRSSPAGRRRSCRC